MTKSYLSCARSSSLPHDQLSPNRDCGVFSRLKRKFRLLVFAASMMLVGVQIAQAQLWTGATDISNTNSGNVGIGTPNPTFTLDILTGAGNNGFRIIPSAAGSTTFRLDAYNDGSTNRNFAFRNRYNALGRLELMRSTSVATDPMTVVMSWDDNGSYFNSGNVGIGTINPTQKLQVAGNINVTATATEAGDITVAGTIHAKYQDVAEWVPSAEQLSAGTVVVLDSTKTNQVTSSSVSYDTRVAGVVSAQPGIALGERSDSKSLIATTGRVKVKVDATRGPIHIGDLLVTSDVSGVAMKSEPIEMAGRKMHMPGTLIGKALEPLEKGKGEILVLLSLQ